MSDAKRIVPDNFINKEFLACSARPCPICGKPDWCRSDGETWALCHRIESLDRWKNAGWLHRLGGAGSVPPAPPTSRAAAAKPKAEDRKIWPSLEVAAAEFDRLPLAREDAAALELFQKDYGLDASAIPSNWRVLEYHGKRGIVFPGSGPDGGLVSFKWKSLARDAGGKRACSFLAGGGGAILLDGQPGAALVIVGGEEKAAACRAAAFSALAGLTGERAPDEAWIKCILENHDGAIICANDCDKAGQDANAATAQALTAAGCDPGRIHVVQWPEGAAAGYDLNDVLKERGVSGLREFLESAPANPRSLPRVLSALDFMAAKRPPLRWHIEGILPYGGKLTFSATSKLGKSFWAMCTGFAIAAGNCEWLGWKFGPPAKVIYLQAELKDELVEWRLNWLSDSMPPALDKQRALSGFAIQEVAEGRPNLLDPQGRGKAEAILRLHQPKVVIIDPLASVCPGLEENAAESMGAALNYFSDLARRFDCAIILVHHHGKAGISRGSSAFEAWPESDLQVSFVDAEARDVCRVEQRLRCSFNAGPLFWKMPTPDAPWFETMPSGWKPEKAGRPSKVGVRHVVLVLKAAGNPLSWRKVVAGVMDIAGCQERAAGDALKLAKESGEVKHENGVYYV